MPTLLEATKRQLLGYAELPRGWHHFEIVEPSEWDRYVTVRLSFNELLHKKTSAIIGCDFSQDGGLTWHHLVSGTVEGGANPDQITGKPFTAASVGCSMHTKRGWLLRPWVHVSGHPAVVDGYTIETRFHYQALAPIPLHYSPTFDSAQTADNNGTSSLTWSTQDTGAFSNLVGVIGVSTTGTLHATTGPTWAGTSGMTRHGPATTTSAWKSYLVTLKGIAASQTNLTIVVTYSASTVGTCGSRDYYDVDQTTPWDTAATNVGDSGAPTVNVSSAVGDLVIDNVFSLGNIGVVGAGQTSRYDLIGVGGINGAGSDEAGAATVTMSWGTVGANEWGTVGLNLNAAAAAGDAVPQAWAQYRRRRAA